MTCSLGGPFWATVLLFLGTQPDVASASQKPPKDGEELVQRYYEIFKTGNRNAASHLWSTHVLNFAEEMHDKDIRKVFRGFCAISGSPITDDPRRTFKVTLPRVTGEQFTGETRHCCWPCICDMTETVRVDSKTIKTADGDRTYDFFVIGDPCKNEAELDKVFTDPFSGREVTLRMTAPELSCANGRLTGAHFSDNGYPIIGMVYPAGTDTEHDATAPVTDVTHGYGNICLDRKQQGYNSGMGLIFNLVAKINPLTTIPATVEATSTPAPTPAPTPKATTSIASTSTAAEMSAPTSTMVTTESPASEVTTVAKSSEQGGKVTVTMLIKNVAFAQLTTAAKEELKSGIQENLAQKADVLKSFVSVELSEGSVKVSAEIKADAGVSSDSIRTALASPDMATSIVKLAKSIEGVKKAAVGEIEVSQPEVAVVDSDGKKVSPLTLSKDGTSTLITTTSPGSTTDSSNVQPHTNLASSSIISKQSVVIALLAVICAFCISA